MLCKKQLIAFKIKERKKSEKFVYVRGDKVGFKKGTLEKNKLRTIRRLAVKMVNFWIL